MTTPEPVAALFRPLAHDDPRRDPEMVYGANGYVKDNGDLVLIGKCRGEFVEIAITFFTLEQLYARSRHIIELQRQVEDKA